MPRPVGSTLKGPQRALNSRCEGVCQGRRTYSCFCCAFHLFQSRTISDTAICPSCTRPTSP